MYREMTVCVCFNINEASEGPLVEEEDLSICLIS